MSGIDGVRAWTPAGFAPVDEPVTATLAADSWLVDDGLVLAAERHSRRFADAVAELGGPVQDALDASEQASLLAPQTGRWSPRLDLTPAGIRLRIRPAPESGGIVDVATAPRDPRTLPLRKGPDLAALGALQEEQSARLGRPVEPVLLGGDGEVAESTRSAVLWWREDALCLPQAGTPRLPSVTAAEVLEIAQTAGVVVREERAEPAELAGCEVWLVNALRGIRAVRSWVDGPAVATAVRAPQWQAMLGDRRAAPVVARR